MSERLKSNRSNFGMGGAAVKAYRGIRSLILDGSFKPGASLTERTLCDATGVSRTPVREALRRLNTEGMVILKAKRGAFVPIVDHQEIEEVFDLIFLFGSYSARIVAQSISDAVLDELHGFVNQ
ncbi:MAG TPA: GntR family transcriptional regulator, partial [Flavobacteriales bacterium]|nr:GntR family transcriptional regulator [Flavobacteriales bacterium]